MEFDLPLYALQRTASDRWVVRALVPDDPYVPGAHIVAAIGDTGVVRREFSMTVRTMALTRAKDRCERCGSRNELDRRPRGYVSVQLQGGLSIVSRS
jgi:hypothetical protein